MAKLYVANLTLQHHDFTYVVPETGKQRMQTIAVGGQIEVFGEAAPEVLSGIVAQHERYGMIAADTIDQSKQKFTGLCYQFGRPVDIGKIVRGIDQNKDVLVRQGVELRKEAAVAAFNNGGGAPGVGQVEVMEIVPSGDTGLHERIQVARDGDVSPPITTMNRRARRAAAALA